MQVPTKLCSTIWRPHTTGCMRRILSVHHPHCHQPVATFFTRKRTLKPKYQADGVTEDNVITYYNSGSNLLYTTLAVTSISVVPVVGATVWNIYTFWDSVPDVLSDIDQPVLPMLLMSAFGLAIVEGVRRVLKPSVIRIYLHEERNEFIAVRPRLWPHKPNIVFAPSDVVWRNSTGFTREMTGNILVKGEPVYVNPKEFRSQAFFNLMMEHANKLGYTKK